jgi:hypothetical protein
MGGGLSPQKSPAHWPVKHFSNYPLKSKVFRIGSSLTIEKYYSYSWLCMSACIYVIYLCLVDFNLVTLPCSNTWLDSFPLKGCFIFCLRIINLTRQLNILFKWIMGKKLAFRTSCALLIAGFRCIGSSWELLKLTIRRNTDTEFYLNK